MQLSQFVLVFNYGTTLFVLLNLILIVKQSGIGFFNEKRSNIEKKGEKTTFLARARIIVLKNKIVLNRLKWAKIDFDKKN